MKLFKSLKAKMFEKEVDQKWLAQKMGVGPHTIGNRMNGRTDWTLTEIYQVCDLLGIDYSQISFYFPRNGHTSKAQEGTYDRP